MKVIIDHYTYLTNITSAALCLRIRIKKESYLFIGKQGGLGPVQTRIVPRRLSYFDNHCSFTMFYRLGDTND